MTVIEEENERDSFIPKPPPVRKSDIKTMKKTVSVELTEQIEDLNVEVKTPVKSNSSVREHAQRTHKIQMNQRRKPLVVARKLKFVIEGNSNDKLVAQAKTAVKRIAPKVISKKPPTKFKEFTLSHA